MATSSPGRTATPLAARAWAVAAATSATTGSSTRTRTRWNGTSAGGVAVAVLVGEGVELVLERRLEGLVGGGDAVGQLLGPAGAHDGRGDDRVGQHPADRQGSERQPGLVGQAAQRVDRVELAVVPVALLVDRPGATEREATLGRRLLASVLAGEEPAGQRVVRDHAHALLLAQ